MSHVKAQPLMARRKNGVVVGLTVLLCGLSFGCTTLQSPPLVLALRASSLLNSFALRAEAEAGWAAHVPQRAGKYRERRRAKERRSERSVGGGGHRDENQIECLHAHVELAIVHAPSSSLGC